MQYNNFYQQVYAKAETKAVLRAKLAEALEALEEIAGATDPKGYELVLNPRAGWVCAHNTARAILAKHTPPATEKP